VAEAAGSAGELELVEAAFLEARPELEEAVARLVERGASRILIIPYFLTLGIHLQRDLPGIVERLSRVHKNVDMRITAPLDGHPGLSAIVLDRAREALSDWK
jgi:sirohydrochlorin ferrochelatase